MLKSNQLKLVPHTSTHLDTISLKYIRNTTKDNDELFKIFNSYLNGQKLYVDTGKVNDFMSRSKVYKNQQYILSVESGTNGCGRYSETTYYNQLNFYGLKSYNNDRDEFSSYIFKKVIKDFNFEMLSELDITLDIINISTHNIFVIKTNAKVRNNPLESYINYKNPDNKVTDTYYVEGFNEKCRAYVYNKTEKEKLHQNITRFEIKIKSNISKAKSVDDIMEVIKKEISKYQIYYFNDTQLCKQSKQIYVDNNLKQSRKLKKFNEDNAMKLDFDLNEIEKLIRKYFDMEQYRPVTLESFYN